MTSPDDHGPATGCTYRACGLDDPETCPFVKDAPDSIPAIDGPIKLGQVRNHQHQYTITLDTLIEPINKQPGAYYSKTVVLGCQCGAERLR